MSRELFSFAIVSYNNYEYIFEAIDSVLNQSYDNIELIVSNDGSSDFKKEIVENYISENKKGNIVNVIINQNETNIGTVRNVDLCRELSAGEYIMYMAADDALYDCNVISRFVEEFNRIGESALCLSGKTVMCGNKLDEEIDIMPDVEGINAIKNFNSEQMFSRLSHTFTIPTTSTCYRKKLYDVIGEYDKRYFIIEDASLYLKMAREGIKFHWIDMFAAKHRDGGISHGNTKNLTEAYFKYRTDEVLLYESEILPFQQRIFEEDREKMLKKWEYIRFSYWDTFGKKKDLKSRGQMLIDAPVLFLKSMIKKMIFNINLIVHLLVVSVIGCGLLCLSSISNIPLIKYFDIAYLFMLFFGIVSLSFIYTCKVMYKVKKLMDKL